MCVFIRQGRGSARFGDSFIASSRYLQEAALVMRSAIFDLIDWVDRSRGATRNWGEWMQDRFCCAVGSVRFFAGVEVAEIDAARPDVDLRVLFAGVFAVVDA